ncbi:glucose--fructose oxidoreductase [Abditibacteriota bacterium]|nr:glucose--fructose oxidoreductase [Abditibacteriota bacterium]
MSFAKVRFAYVGCGFVAQNIHIPNFVSLPECEFIGLAEVQPGLAEQVAGHYGIPRTYASHEEICSDDSIEAVGVSGPYALQGQIARDLLRAGKHVFMEKPMAVSIRQAQSIVDTAKSSGARCMVGYMKRYDAGNLRIKELCDEWRASGEMGRLLLARNHGFGGNWVWAQDPNVRTFVAPSGSVPPPAPDECPEWMPDEARAAYLNYLQQWTHNINLLRFFLDDHEGKARVTSVQLDADGHTGLVVLDVNGTRAVVESAYTRFHAWDEHTQLYFEGGWLQTSAPPLLQKGVPATIEIYRGGSLTTLPMLTREQASPSWAYREEARTFLGLVRSGEAFPSSAQDTLTDVRLCEDIYRIHLGL